jgi:hypothetical protein
VFSVIRKLFPNDTLVLPQGEETRGRTKGAPFVTERARGFTESRAIEALERERLKGLRSNLATP